MKWTAIGIDYFTGCELFSSGMLTVLLAGPESREYKKTKLWHLSISHPGRYPKWDEIFSARYALIPNEINMAMYLPRREEYINIHKNCFHLYECRC